jgi:TetR/AcrR family transcriptional regulator, transcriptional repressor for nem operon
MNAKHERKAKTHLEIVRSASALLRTRGIAAASVANVMGDLGLTVGGFYAHFKSKDALIAKALDSVMSDSWRALIERHAGQPLAQRLGAIADGYLTASHRDKRGDGCPMPAIASELPAQDRSVRKAFQAALERNLQLLREATQLGDDEALAAVALLVGSLAIARATHGSELSDRILAAGRKAARRIAQVDS